MLSVMVILLSEMNSYRIRVASAVLSPSRAPCLVLALKKKGKNSLLPLNFLLGALFNNDYDNKMFNNLRVN